ncbi:MAG: Uma2 family endonuclease [Taibaiella sp.]|nr:Uma2 family endonuclease [Taibaiella sp.]
MTLPAFKYTSPETYLQMEENAFERYEYIGGEVYAMAGATEKHNMVVLNTGGEIRSFLKGQKCKVYPSDFRLSISLSETYMYPDLTIVCGETELKAGCFDTLTNPAVIIEVLSPSTQERDRVLKFFFYRQIPSFKEYILIDTTQHKVATFLKQPDGTWEESITDGRNAILHIDTIDMQLPMEEIYARVDVG